MDIVKFLNEKICDLYGHGHRLLYLTKFGSHLYGMDTPNSDLDFKGVFLPNKQDMLLGKKTKSLRYSSGNDNDRNNNEDVDVELWSLQYFLELVGKGETGAIDLLYSFTHKECVGYADPIMEYMFSNPLRLFDLKNCNAFIHYSKNKIKKYGSAATRLGSLKNVYEYLEHIRVDDVFYGKLSDIVEEIIDKFYDSSYCFMKEVNGEKALVLCGKVHLFSISLDEFYNRIEKEYKKHGKRVIEAYKNNNVDWKAVSHALRCLYQTKELLTTGKIAFPLRDAKYLNKIKQGEFNFKEVDVYIQEQLDEVEKLQQTSNVYGYKDKNLVRNLILDAYGM